MRLLPALLLVMILSACGSQYSLVETKRRDIGQAYSVEPQIEWSTQVIKVPSEPGEKERVTSAFHKYEVWTVDGGQLESLLLYMGLRDGDPLFPKTGLEKQKFPLFRGTMQASEVTEFVVDSLSRLGNSEVEAKNLRPADFGALPGFRFELAYLSKTGLAFDGMAVGVVNEGVLYMILFTGAHGYYFPKYRDAVERLFDSVQFIEKAAALSGPHRALGEHPQAAAL